MQFFPVRDFRGRLIGKIEVSSAGVQTTKWKTAGIGTGIYFIEGKPYLLLK